MTNQRRALIVDDERLARKRLRDLLAPHPEVEVVGEADSVESAARLAAELQPDLLFLDVEMPPNNGFDLLPMLPEDASAPDVVFVTAYENFALRAFEVSAVDYLLKPIHPERLAITIRRLSAGPRRDGEAEVPGEEQQWGMTSKITLSDRRLKQVVEVAVIVSIQALGAYSRVSLLGLPPIIVLRSISEWERRLPPGEFCRVDRSLIIQHPLLRKMEMKSRDETEIFLKGVDAPLTVGRAATARLKKQLRENG